MPLTDPGVVPDQDDSAEILERAAARLEELLAGVSPGPWVWDLPWRTETDVSRRAADDSAYIAAMNPAVGRELVPILRGIAEGMRDGRWPGGPGLVALARAVLGEDSRG